MPHNSTSPTRDARQAAASELRARAAALRELAAAAAANAAKEATSLEHTSDQAIEWARTRADELEQVATWLAEPFGRCDECRSVLEHFDTGNVGGVMCPECDGEHVAELVELEPARVRDRVEPARDPYELERDRTPVHKLPRAQRKCPVCKAPGVITAPHLRQLQATCSDPACGWHYSERFACAVCKHDELAHEQTGKVECECCAAGVLHRTDPDGPAFAAAIAHGLKSRVLSAVMRAEQSRGMLEAAAKGPAGALLAAAKLAEPPRALCSDCGRPMMIDHSVCFSDDCVRARAEAAAEREPPRKRTRKSRAPAPALAALPAPCMECGEPLRGATGTICNACKDLKP